LRRSRQTPFYSFLLVDMNGPTSIPAAIFNPRRI